MIKAVNSADKNVMFGAKSEKKENNFEMESRILPNTLKTRLQQKYQKTSNAFLQYPVKGLKGDVNSDFYEFLSMGIIPYLVGSGMFMGLFNLVNKHLSNPKSRVIAGINGKKMALGVVLYGLMKTLSPDLVTRPVYWGTGVDIELPIEHVYYPLPKEPGEAARIIPQVQQRKVYDSREFFRKKKKKKDIGVSYYDNVAKKLGLGEDLNDSVTETTPIIQNIVSTTKTAKSLSSYAWAGLGVGLAAQDCWEDFFTSITNRKRHIAKPGEGFGTKMASRLKNFGTNTVEISKTFLKSFGKSFKTLWTGDPGKSGFMKHAGKAWMLFTAALTVGTTANVIYKARHMGKLANKDIMDKSKESTVI